MELTHEFSVPTGIDETWQHFNDPQALSECFPGAQVTGVDGDSFTGTAKIKLGPIALVYTGTGEYADRDESAHTMTVNAKGKDKRGNGTAGATVKVALTAAGEEQTKVQVKTDLNVTGKPAQFGRGVMQDVSDKLLGQFVACLEKKLSVADSSRSLSEERSDESATRSLSEERSDESATRSLSEERSDESKGPEPAQSTPSPAPTPPPSPAASGSPSEGTESSSRSLSEGGTTESKGQETPKQETPKQQPPKQQESSQDKDSEALDLGATVLPVLIKNYWREGLIALLGLLVLRGLFRR